MTTSRRRGRADQAARATLAPLVAAGSAVCWRCGEPIAATDKWDAGHLDDLALGGRPDGEVAPEHRGRCNRAAGARLGNAIRRGRRVRLADWLAFFPAAPATNTPGCPVFLPTQPGVSGRD